MNHRGLLLLAAIASLATGSVAKAQAPQIFFTDLSSGPNSGGETVSGYAGVYVTLYGNFFGASQGSSTVTLDGASCLRVVSWGTSYLWYQKIVVQLGSTCATGNLVVTTGAGASNAVPFTVRSGNIRCISTTGNDSASGQFPGSCWATMANAASTLVAGDTVYLEDGVVNTTIGEYTAVVNITNAGTADAPIAYVAYPGATATIGDFDNSPYAIRVPEIGVTPNYIVIAGLTIRGQETLDLDAISDWWVVGNDLSCSGASGYGCVHVATTTYLYIYGNNLHDNGSECASNGNTCKLFHGMYLTTNTNDAWLGWNLVDPDPMHTGVAGCRGIQFYSTGGADQFDLHVHDNIIRNTICDGLNFATVNPDMATVEAYNNVIYHAGTGPDPSNQSSDYACIYANASAAYTNSVAIYNNTLYDCGSAGSSASDGSIGALSLDTPAKLTNNLVGSVSSAEPYFVGSSCPSGVTGSNDDWFGAGTAPCSLASDLSVDPMFAGASAGNFTLTAGSPAIGKGTAIASLTTDILGYPRPQSGAYALGAYEYESAGAVAAASSSSGTTSGAASGTTGGATSGGAAAGTTGGSSGSSDGGVSKTSSSGCGCTTGGDGAAVLALAALAIGRRRRTP